mmetsp:Transcript_29930/g.45350  ORF Transcript_29930/g.45350 Transcript_29930/m.45350 type:complete len:115 (-) Transcript_29930:124-468(-)
MIYATHQILKENASFDSTKSSVSASSFTSTPSLSSSLSIAVTIRKQVAVQQDLMRHVAETNYVLPGKESMATTTRRTKRGKKHQLVKDARDYRREKVAQYEALRLLYKFSERFD